MATKVARAEVGPRRQPNQFCCMSTSLQMAMHAFGVEQPINHIIRVMGAEPKRGASWEQFLLASQHFGFRCVLISPGSIENLKWYTDQGIPCAISWNPEGRPWAHASLVFDVVEDEAAEQVSDRAGPPDNRVVLVADPNNPDPVETVRAVPAGEFYKKWVEQWPDQSLVRHVMVAIFPEVTPEGEPGEVLIPFDKQAAQRGRLKTACNGACPCKHHEEAMPEKNPEEAVMGEFHRERLTWKSAAEDKEASTLNQVLDTIDEITDGEYEVREGYSGRGMTGRISPLAITVDSHLGPHSKEGAALEALGFTSDNTSMGWAYFLKETHLPRVAMLRTAARAPSGLYGFTKSTQRDCEAAQRKLAKVALSLAKRAFSRDEKIVPFLQTHAKRAKSQPARVLMAALREVGPKLAKEIKGGKTASTNEYGLYGYQARTARTGLDLCTEIRAHAGRIAANLHRRRFARYERITGFLKQHSKAGHCTYSRMLLASYPDRDRDLGSLKTASEVAPVPVSVESWISWKD